MNSNEDNRPGERRVPLRTFSDMAPRRKGSLGPELERYWYFLAPLLILLLITGLGLFASKAYYASRPNQNFQSTNDTSFLGENGDIDNEAFIKSYLQAKGLQLDSAKKLKFLFRGTFAKGNEMVGFSGEADLIRNGLLEMGLARKTDRDNLVFNRGSMESQIDTLGVDDKLAVYSLVRFFHDPLIEYAIS